MPQKKKGNTVTLCRRLLAFYIDLVFCTAITLVILKVFSDKKVWKVTLLIYGVMYVFFLLQQLLFKGRTIGRHTVRITVSDLSGSNPKLWQLMIRTFIRVTVLMQGCMLIPMCTYFPAPYVHKAKVICALCFVGVWCLLLLDGWVATLRQHRSKVLLYEILTHTMCVSTLSLSSSIALTKMEVQQQMEE